MEFIKFDKIPRFNRQVWFTEKLDGTNAQIYITEDRHMYTGSRNRWITPEDDNYGFSKWAHENKDELLRLGPGSHFGEWVGKGIQRGYGMEDKKFYLFNVQRWIDKATPECCSVVPLLHVGLPSDIGYVMDGLSSHGSWINGFDRPEGVIMYHEAAKQYFKVLFENDHLPKGE